MSENATSWKQLRDEQVAPMSTDQRAAYDAVEAKARLRLAELVYGARAEAGMTQTELARRAGTRQTVISAIENGAQVPGGVMLERIAAAPGGTLRIDVAA